MLLFRGYNSVMMIEDEFAISNIYHKKFDFSEKHQNRHIGRCNDTKFITKNKIVNNKNTKEYISLFLLYDNGRS